MPNNRQDAALQPGQQLISVSGLITTAGGLRTVQDPPVLHDAAVPPDKQFRVGQTLQKSGQAVSGNALAAGMGAIAKLQAGLQTASAAVALRQIETLQRLWQVQVEQLAAIERHLTQRTTHGPWSMAKAILLIIVLGLSDTALNASASIAGGDPVWLSVAEFAGVAAAAVGVGWLVGHLLSRLVSAHRAGQVPETAKDLGIDSFYRRPGDRLLMLVLCLLLLAVTGVLCWAVADLRVEAQMSWVYGLFTAVVSIGAAAVAYVAEEPIGKFFAAHHTEVDRTKAQLDALVGHVNHARGLEAELGTELIGLATHADASAAAIVVQGEFEIQFAHPETYGHLAPREPQPQGMPFGHPAELIELMVKYARPITPLPFAQGTAAVTNEPAAKEESAVTEESVATAPSAASAEPAAATDPAETPTVAAPDDIPVRPLNPASTQRSPGNSSDGDGAAAGEPPPPSMNGPAAARSN